MEYVYCAVRAESLNKAWFVVVFKGSIWLRKFEFCYRNTGRGLTGRICEGVKKCSIQPKRVHLPDNFSQNFRETLLHGIKLSAIQSFSQPAYHVWLYIERTALH